MSQASRSSASRIVDAAHCEGIAVVPIPGACAAIAALSAAGLPSDRFCFEGFVPSKRSQRKIFFAQRAKEVRTLVFYETPHRIVESLKVMQEILGGERRITIARELTKQFEQIVRAPLNEINEKLETEEIVKSK